MKNIWNRFRDRVNTALDNYRFGKAFKAYMRLVCVHQFIADEEFPFTCYFYSRRFKGIVKVKMWSTDVPSHKCKIVYPEGNDGEALLMKRHFVRGIGWISPFEFALMDMQFEEQGGPNAG